MAIFKEALHPRDLLGRWRLAPDVVGDRKSAGTWADEGDVQALKSYVGNSLNSGRINGLLRHGEDYLKPAPPKDRKDIPGIVFIPAAPEDSVAKIAKTRDDIKALDRAFERVGPLGKPVHVYRGVTSREKLGEIKVGDTIVDPGFQSTSPERDEAYYWASQGVLFDMTVDPRVRAIWGANSEETELLLERGCRALVKSVEEAKDGKLMVKVDVLPPLRGTQHLSFLGPSDVAGKVQSVGRTVLLGEATVSSLPLTNGNGNAMLLSVVGKAGHVINFVKHWDPNKHPRGYKGLFIDTPDKLEAGKTHAGDVLAAKSGKLFQVEHQTEKGVKVKPVDTDTGEVKTGYTVLSNDVQVARVVKAEEYGKPKKISELDVGTYVQHPNSGKRFKITNQGKWTTVYPVDDHGDVTGKHTVLPPQMGVLVSQSQVNGSGPTPKKRPDKDPEPAKPPAVAKAYISAAFHIKPEDLADTVLSASFDTALERNTPEEWAAYYADVIDHVDPADGHAFPGGREFGETIKARVDDATRVYNKWSLENTDVAGPAQVKLPDPPKIPDAPSSDDAIEAITDKTFEIVKLVIEETDKAYGYNETKYIPNAGIYSPYQENHPTYWESQLRTLVEKEVRDSFAKAPSWTPSNARDYWKHAVTNTLDEAVYHANKLSYNAPGSTLLRQFHRSWPAYKTDRPDTGPASYDVIKKMAKLLEVEEPGEKASIGDYTHGFGERYKQLVHPHFVQFRAEERRWAKKKHKLESDYQQQVQSAMALKAAGEAGEILPVGLKRPPKKYPAGVGKDTMIVVEEIDNSFLRNSFEGETPPRYGQHYLRIKRVSASHPDGAGQLLGWETQVGRALALARSQPAHEAIVRRTSDVNTENAPDVLGMDENSPDKPEEGAFYVETSGRIVRLKNVKWKQGVYSGNYLWHAERHPAERDYRYARQEPLYAKSLVHKLPKPIVALDKATSGKKSEITEDEAIAYDASFGRLGGDGNLRKQDQYSDWVGVPASWMKRFYEEHDMVNTDEDKDKQVRGPRPTRYAPELRHDFSHDDVVGLSVNEAIKKMRVLGYEEIRPRKAGNPKLINGLGRRLHMEVKDGEITNVDELKPKYDGHSQSVSQFHEQLVTQLQTFEKDKVDKLQQKAVLGALNPADDPDLEVRNSITHQMLFDMAMGKVSGVEATAAKPTGPKVKSDKTYELEILKEAGANVRVVSGQRQVDWPTAVSGKSPYHALYYEDLVPEEPEKLSGVRGQIIEKFGMRNHADWDFATRTLKVPNDLSVEERTALYTIAKHPGAANIVWGESKIDIQGVTPTYGEPLVDDGADIYDAARALAAERSAAKQGMIDGLDQNSRSWLAKTLSSTGMSVQSSHAARTADKLRKMQNMADQALTTETRARRKKEGTVSVAPASVGGATTFEIPTWDEVSLEPQDPVTVQQLVNNIGDRHMDVPAFYTGGLLKDGVVQWGDEKSRAKVPHAMDEIAEQRLVQAGAEETTNSMDLGKWFGYHGSGTLYPGTMFVLHDTDVSQEATDSAKIDEAMDYITDRLVSTGYLNDDGKATGGPGSNQLAALVEVAQDRATEADTYAGFVASLQEEAEADHIASYPILDDDIFPKLNSLIASGRGKRIEYVPHDQKELDRRLDSQGLTRGAPNAQRGMLRLYGYDVAEGTRKLQELGFVHDLEPEVPFSSIMRSGRRYGRVVPLHSDYVAGTPPPVIKAHISHGITGGTADLLNILRTGALLPIDERVWFNLRPKSATSPAGDVRSGTSEAIFTNIGLSHWGDIKVVFKDSAYLRRDIVASSRDFGSAASRYDAYTKGHNNLRAKVGEKPANLYEPLSPAARQEHITSRAGGSYDNEWDLIPGAAIEDWDKIYIPSNVDKDQVDDLLQGLVREGFVSSVPEVLHDTHPDISV